jgi:hypothetical protein
MSREFREAKQLPPGVGIVRIASDEPMTGADHFAGWGAALDQALQNIGRAPGRYRFEMSLGGTVEIRNPGHVVEYIVTLT